MSLPDVVPAPRVGARFALVLLASLAAMRALAQPSLDDAGFEKKLAAAPVAEESALLLARAASLGANDTARAYELAQRARKAAVTPHDELLADAHIATLQRLRGEYGSAFRTASAALHRAAELHDDPARAELLLAFARCSWGLGDYPAAMTAHQELIALATKLNDRRLVARGHLGLSVIYGEMKDGAKARAEEEITLAIARETDDRETEADALNNLGNNSLHAGDFAAARTEHEQSLAIRTAMGNRRGMGDSHINLAEVVMDTRDFPAALDHAQQALAIYEQVGLKRYVANAHLQLAAILRASGRLDEALTRLQTGFAVAEAIGNPAQMVEFHQESAALAAARGDWQTAYDSERKRAIAADAVLGEKTTQQLAALSARYEAERHQHEIALLRGERARREAELRAKNADLLLSSSELESANATHFALGTGLLALAIALGAIITVQRGRLRAERRVLAETQSARESAEEADRVKTRFLGIASHDIRGPLGNIVNLSDLLRQSRSDDPERTARLDTIATEAQRVLCLVEDLLTTAALETGKLELRFAPVDLADVVNAAIDSLRWQADAKRQHLIQEPVPRGSALIDGDSARLHQVVSNLIANAIKFSPPGSSTVIALRSAEATVTLSVRDEGPGLTPDDAARLFAPFQRLSSHPSAGVTSHGLGLSIANEIVRLHGGTIRVESQAGAGATFFVELPRHRPPS